MTYQEALYDEYRRGEAIGEARGKTQQLKETILQLLCNLPIEEVARLLNLPIEKVQQISSAL